MYSVFFRDLSALLLYAITTALFLLWDIFNIVDYLVYGYAPTTSYRSRIPLADSLVDG